MISVSVADFWETTLPSIHLHFLSHCLLIIKTTVANYLAMTKKP